MKRIIVGQYERVYGVVGLDSRGDWVLNPQDATPEELHAAVETLFTRVQGRRRMYTRAQFLDCFFAKTGAPQVAHATSLWGKRELSPQLLTILNLLRPAYDPLLAALRQHDHDIALRMQSLQHA